MTKRYSIFALIVLIGIGGVLFWAFSGNRSEAESLTQLSESDIEKILASQAAVDNSATANVTVSKESRQAFLTGLREHLALAAAARDEGLDTDKLFEINRAYKTRLLLADLYEVEQGHGPDKPFPISEQEFQAFWSESGNENAFKRDMDTLLTIQTDVQTKMGTGIRPGPLAGESLTKARKRWARAKILSSKAEGDAKFMSSENVKLRLRVLEAGILSSEMLRKHWNERIKATNAEIAEFIRLNPQYDLGRKRELAEQALARVKNGEDIAKLAAQLTEHRPTKNLGGLIENMTIGDMPAALETALLSAAAGQVIDRLIETELGFHIAKLERKGTRETTDGRDVVVYSFRQILFQNKFEQPGVTDPNIPPPFMTAEEIAQMQIEREKRDRFVAEYLAKYRINVPEDFSARTD